MILDTFQTLAPQNQRWRGRMTRFAAVGAIGTIVNLLVMALLVHRTVSISYVVAAVIAAEISILHNFVLQERFVFRDMRAGVSSLGGPPHPAPVVQQRRGAGPAAFPDPPGRDDARPGAACPGGHAGPRARRPIPLRQPGCNRPKRAARHRAPRGRVMELSA